MSLLLPVLLKSACPSTHHKLVIDALRFLRGDAAEAWRDLFLRHHKPLFAGAKAPDDELRDFANHVLYVGPQRFGGAAEAARQWFDQLVAALAECRWPDAAYALGILSHYASDPFMPLNTRQSEAGNIVQLGIEWSVCRTYGQIQSVLEEDFGGYPAIEIPAESDSVERVIRSGAELAVQHYDALIGHFDLTQALLDPEEALDQESQDRLALCLGAAVVSVARIIELALKKSAAEPPKQEMSGSGLVASLKAPFRLISCHNYEQITQRRLEAMHDELELTGQVAESLPEEQREIRRQFAEEVLHVSPEALGSQMAAVAGKLRGQGAAPRYRPHRLRSGPGVVRTTSLASQLAGMSASRSGDDEPAILRIECHLSRASPIEDAPMVAPTMAARLRAAAIDTIGDLLAADPEFLAGRLRRRDAGKEAIMTWQAITGLCCQFPKLRGHEAEWLVAAGLRSPADLMGLSPQQIVSRLAAAAESHPANNRLRGEPPMDEKRVVQWLPRADEGRFSRAA